MKTLFSYILAFWIIFNIHPSKTYASGNDVDPNRTQTIIANKYAEKFCSAKFDNFFEGLDDEKTLKYSYFKYIGLKNEEIFSKDLYKILIHQIKEQCNITNKEEREINEFYVKYQN